MKPSVENTPGQGTRHQARGKRPAMSRAMRRAMTLSCLVTAVGSVSITGGCGQSQSELDLVQVELKLAIDFESDDLLEVSVFEAQVATCGNIGPTSIDSLERVGREQASAVGLNAGEVTLDFVDLPADVPLTFYGRVKRPGEDDLIDDCAPDVSIPEGQNVAVELVLVSP